jgi:hypothetical protein
MRDLLRCSATESPPIAARPRQFPAWDLGRGRHSPTPSWVEGADAIPTSRSPGLCRWHFERGRVRIPTGQPHGKRWPILDACIPWMLCRTQIPIGTLRDVLTS